MNELGKKQVWLKRKMLKSRNSGSADEGKSSFAWVKAPKAYHHSYGQ